MPDLDIPALRAAASAGITSADVLTVATDPDGDRFVLEADGQWTDLMRRTRHSGAVVERFGGQVSHIAVPVATLMALLDAAEQHGRLLMALTIVSEGHETELPDDVINGYCAGCEPAGYAREVLVRENDDA